ncbi:AEC family transporter [Salinispora sp. H7-4]|uniref:AEC family transporter n=1 Tax=Salinispora sp. H7-4 TaxID=2748321 RepID=UPI0015D40199|nr:AEC family transporter [Salinispora sp. H7-4]NYT95405.1 AEC family transporter [Salinispora sp. H7-4]
MEALAVFEKLVPVALALGGGVWFARRSVVSAASSKVFADFAFLFAVPCYLFANIYRSDLDALFAWPALTGYAVTAGITMAVVGVLAWLTRTREPRQLALRIMAAVQVNTAYFAVPVFIMLFGDAAPVFPVLLFQVCVLTLVVLAIMELNGAPVKPVLAGQTVPVSAGGGGRRPTQPTRGLRPTQPGGPPPQLQSRRGRVGRAVWGALTTPVVLACNAGLLLNLLAVRMPEPLLGGFDFVGAAAAPIALFALGLHLGGSGVSFRHTTGEEIWLIAVKCLLFPFAVWLAAAHVFEIDGPWLTYLVLIAAMPAPQNLFIVAQRYGVDVELSAALVVKSSVAALLLLPLWVHWAQAG